MNTQIVHSLTSKVEIQASTSEDMGKLIVVFLCILIIAGIFALVCQK